METKGIESSSRLGEQVYKIFLSLYHICVQQFGLWKYNSCDWYNAIVFSAHGKLILSLCLLFLKMISLVANGILSLWY